MSDSTPTPNPSSDVVISANTTWTKSESPYVFQFNVTIAKDTTLTIESGVSVRFDRPLVYPEDPPRGLFAFYVEGTLRTNSTTDEPVYFTSNASSPWYSDWSGIIVQPSGHVTLNNSIIEYAYVNIFLNQSDGHIIENSSIMFGDWAGIYAISSDGNRFARNMFERNGKHAIVLEDCERNLVVSSTFHERSFGILLDISSNNSILENSINGSDAIVLVDSHQNNLSNNLIFGSSSTGMYLGSSGGNLVAQNRIHDNYNGLDLMGSYSNLIRLNSIANNHYGVNCWNALSDTFRNNSFLGNAIYAVYARNCNLDLSWNFWGSENTSALDSLVFGISGPTNPLPDDSTGMGLKRVLHENWTDAINLEQPVLVDDTLNLHNANVVFNASESQNLIQIAGSLFVENCSFSSVSSSRFTILFLNGSNGFIRNSTYFGGRSISLQGHNVQLKSNEIDGGLVGLTLTKGASNNTIEANRVQSNENVGVYMHYADFNIIRRNEITENKPLMGFARGGMYLWSSSSNAIVENTIERNYFYGLLIEGENEANKIFHNSFVDNYRQASQEGDSAGNIWEDGYPSGGNYWSDYSGSDFFRGPNQDILGSDSIGDTPYTGMSGKSTDRYPLMTNVSPPTGIEGHLQGKNYQNISIQWNLSIDDGERSQRVVAYEIRRGTFYDRYGLEYGAVSRIPAGNSSYIDSYSGEGDPSNYFYVVCSIDILNFSSCSDRQVAKFTRPLKQGWNLLSTPVRSGNMTTSSVLETVRFNAVRAYNANDSVWTSFASFKSYQQDFVLCNSEGFWVNVTAESNFTVVGIVPLTISINLKQGWNLISFPSFTDTYTVGDLKLEVNGVRVETFDSLREPYLLGVAEDTEILKTGFAYWVKVTEDVEWILHN